LSTTVHLITVVGARPQFVKAAALCRAVSAWNETDPRVRFRHDLLHTGQHYDEKLSQAFFDQLDIPAPARNLGVGSGPHGQQTGRMLEALEAECQQRQPDWVIVPGDTNSTLAGGLASAKLHIPVAHIEAGLRSFNRAMPEEINRILTDHLSDLLLCPTDTAVENLRKEGITRGVHQVGDVMYDAVLFYQARAEESSTVLRELALETGAFYLATIHRAENTDAPDRLSAILAALGELSRPVVLPLHPRTKNILEQRGVSLPSNVRAVPAMDYLDMLMLQKHARAVLTDSGGVQKEAYWMGTLCVTLRDQTEWTELVEAGVNRLAGADRHAIVEAVDEIEASGEKFPDSTRELYGDGNSARHILEVLAEAGGATM
jgi:UDP-GlcNAc3NAcA epimerase